MRKKSVFILLILILFCAGCANSEDKPQTSSLVTRPLSLFHSAELRNYNEDDDTGTRIRFVDYSDGNITVYCQNHNQDVLNHYPISYEDFEPILEKIIDYSDIVAKDNDLYNPHSKEYPAMRSLFYYKIVTDLDSIKYDGVLAKPKDYDIFVEDIVNDTLKLAEDSFISARLFGFNDDNTMTEIYFLVSPRVDSILVDCRYHNDWILKEYDITSEEFEPILDKIKRYKAVLQKGNNEGWLNESPETLMAIQYELNTTTDDFSYESDVKPEDYDAFIDSIVVILKDLEDK